MSPRRLDLPPDPFAGRRGRVQEPKRMETVATMPATQAQQRMRVRVETPSSDVVADSTNVVLDWTAEAFDTAGLHSLSTLPSRLVIPSTGLITGTWVFHAFVSWNGAPIGGTRRVSILRNGVTLSAAHDTRSGVNTTVLTQEVLVHVNDPSAGDYFQVQVFQNSGATENIALSGTNTYFEAYHAW